MATLVNACSNARIAASCGGAVGVSSIARIGGRFRIVVLEVLVVAHKRVRMVRAIFDTHKVACV